MPEYLLIGGESDGIWKSIPETWDTCRVPQLPLGGLLAPPGGRDSFNADPTLKIDIYRREVWHLSEGTIHMFVFEGMSRTQVLRRLIEYYRPPPERHA